MNNRLLATLTNQTTDSIPIWLMRQAGRYLPEYRAVRATKPDFMSFCKTPELCCEVTLQPLERYALDAAILFSDILTIPDAMNLGLNFVANEGPVFNAPLRNESQIRSLQMPDIEHDLDYVTQTIKLIKKALNNQLPLIGFSGSPWTLACYMVEGQSSKTFSIIKSMLYSRPELLQHLLQLLSESVIAYLKMQIQAGVDTIMLFDTWGGILTTRAYHDFSLKWMQHIVHALKTDPSLKQVPVILFTKNGAQWAESIAATGCAGLGLDWTWDISAVRKQLSYKVTLQGNMDPSILFGSPELIQQEVQRIMTSLGADKSQFIFNLGHGIQPGTPPENVAAMVEAVRKYGKLS